MVFSRGKITTSLYVDKSNASLALSCMYATGIRYKLQNIVFPDEPNHVSSKYIQQNASDRNWTDFFHVKMYLCEASRFYPILEVRGHGRYYETRLWLSFQICNVFALWPWLPTPTSTTL